MKRANFIAAVVCAVGLILATIWTATADEDEIVGFADVIDGDTIILRGMQYDIAGIDAPEYSERASHRGEIDEDCAVTRRDVIQPEFSTRDWVPCGYPATQNLRLIARSEFRCKHHGYNENDDRQIICGIWSETLGQNVDIADLLLREGFARNDPDSSPDYSHVPAKQSGFWACDAVAPKEWDEEKKALCP